jgi:hypothetical protein
MLSPNESLQLFPVERAKEFAAHGPVVVTISSSMNNPSGEGADFSVRLARQFDD